MTTLLEKTAGLVAFVRTVELGSFTTAARAMGTTPSAVSKSVARLERRLGVQLLQRSTRALGLTSAGRAYHARVAPLLQQLEEADGALHPESEVSGKLRVTASHDLGRTLIAPWMKPFLERHPRLNVELRLTEANVELIKEGCDLALRMRHQRDTGLIARKLVDLRLVLAASPSYLETHGVPRRFEDLKKHDGVRFLIGGRPFPFSLADGSSLVPNGRFDCDDGGAVREAVLAGVGVGYLLRFTVAADLAAGRLVELLPSVTLPTMPLFAVHAYAQQVPVRVRVLIDFLLEQFKGAAF